VVISFKGGTVAKVTVYSFEAYNHQIGATDEAKSMATLEAIKSVKGTPLMDTALDVEESEVDGNGFRKAKAK
jgi:hypothetical protein